jgi:peptidoglycan L-alanyl-D-glutamate endopeptidase CwlK
MPRLSNLSEQRLATCDERLQRLLREAIQHVDFTVLCGYRDRDEQDDAFRRGASTKRWPMSKHNRVPSVAVDVAPYPVDWKDTARFARLAGYIERIAHEQGVSIRWGGDFDGDGRTSGERFIDMPHLEIVG